MMSNRSRSHGVSPWIVLGAIAAAGGVLVGGLSTAMTSSRDAGSMLSFAPFDGQDDDKLMAFSSDVFVGRIIAKVSSEGSPTTDPDFDIPRTQFSAEVGERLKGSVEGTVIVSQAGGLDATTGELSLTDGDPLLKRGERYLLFARFNPETGWYDLTLPNLGNRLITSADQWERLLARYSEVARVGSKEAVDGAVLLQEPDPSEVREADIERPTQCLAEAESGVEQPSEECWYPAP
jgi:hypothetical protein